MVIGKNKPPRYPNYNELGKTKMSTVSSSSGTVRRPFSPAVWIMRAFFSVCLLAASGIGWFGITQLFASRELAKFTRDLESRGIPYDNATMQKAFRDKTHAEGSETLKSIIRLSKWGSSLASVQAIPFVGAMYENSSPWMSLIGLKEWPTDDLPEQIVSDYLAEMEPMFTLLDQLEKMPKPVRIELEMNGYWTSLAQLDDARLTMQVLSLEARYAIFKKDKPRTMRAIKSMVTLAQALDSQSFLMVDYMVEFYRTITRAVIQESMTCEFWDLAETRALKDMIESRRLNHFNRTRAWEWERAMAMSSIESSTGFWNSGEEMIYMIPKFPSAKLKIMKHYEEHIKISGLPRDQKNSHLGEMERDLMSFSNLIDGTSLILGVLLPSSNWMIDIEERSEDSAKFALIACGIRQFKLENNRLPTNLDELTSVGVPRELFSTTNRGRFGFVVEDGKAWLWSYDFRNPLNKVAEVRSTDPNQYQYQPTLSFE
jgi:hypothetical protein